MGLGNRHANGHDTVAMRKHALQGEIFADFTVGQRVQTVDGFPGVVAAVDDGPFPGTETYTVTLDNGMGGGQYRTGHLAPIEGVTASGVYTASEDYPELRDILVDRPDIAEG